MCTLRAGTRATTRDTTRDTKAACAAEKRATCAFSLGFAPAVGMGYLDGAQGSVPWLTCPMGKMVRIRVPRCDSFARLDRDSDVTIQSQDILYRVYYNVLHRVYYNVLQ